MTIIGVGSLCSRLTDVTDQGLRKDILAKWNGWTLTKRIKESELDENDKISFIIKTCTWMCLKQNCVKMSDFGQTGPYLHNSSSVRFFPTSFPLPKFPFPSPPTPIPEIDVWRIEAINARLDGNHLSFLFFGGEKGIFLFLHWLKREKKNSSPPKK